LLDKPSPMEELGSNDFIERYSELFTVRAEQSDITSTLINWKAHAVFLTHFNDRNGQAEYRHVCAYLNLLNRAVQKRQTQRLFNRVYETIQKLGFGMEASFHDRPSIPLTGSFKERIEKLLDCYQTTYESFLRLVYAPAVIAYRITSNKDSDNLKLDSDGLVRVAGIREIEMASIFPSNHFRAGINSTLRNARAHRHYELFSEDLEIEYWDANTPKQRISEQQIESLIDGLFINSLSAADAIIVWFMNHSYVARKRKWIATRKPPRMNIDRYRGIAKRTAIELGFSLESLTRDKETSTEEIILKTNPKGIDQTSQMFRGGDDWSESFDIDVKYVEAPVIEQVTTLLLVLSNIASMQNWAVSVVDWESKQPICQFRTMIGIVRSLERESKKDKKTRIKKAFNWEVRTDVTMFVETRAQPRRATPRLRKKPK